MTICLSIPTYNWKTSNIQKKQKRENHIKEKIKIDTVILYGYTNPKDPK